VVACLSVLLGLAFHFLVLSMPIPQRQVNNPDNPSAKSIDMLKAVDHIQQCDKPVKRRHFSDKNLRFQRLSALFKRRKIKCE
jgi:hypothetical protein